MGLVPSPMCSFCEKSEESLEHVFIYCDTSKDFSFSVIEWSKELKFWCQSSECTRHNIWTYK